MPDMESWPTVRLLSTAARLVERAWNEKLQPIRLTHAGVIVLDVVSVMGPITQAGLARIARVRAQTMGASLARLEHHGYVVHASNPSDHRDHLVSITTTGAAVLEKAHELEHSVLANVAVHTLCSGKNFRR